MSEKEINMTPEYIFGNCYYNATVNRKIFETMFNKKFKIVVGGLGMSGWFEYGHNTPDSKKYYKNPLDSHAWLESEDGFIVDYMFGEYATLCQNIGVDYKFPLHRFVVGTREDMLRKYNLEYVTASEKRQKDIWNNVKIRYDMEFKRGILPRIKWILS